MYQTSYLSYPKEDLQAMIRSLKERIHYDSGPLFHITRN